MILVLVVRTPPARARGFSLMKLIKGELQAAMKTQTLDSCMFVKFHGPIFTDDLGCATLVITVAERFWLCEVRAPSRVNGSKAAVAVRVCTNEKKRKAMHLGAEAKTCAQNEQVPRPVLPPPSYRSSSTNSMRRSRSRIC